MKNHNEFLSTLMIEIGVHLILSDNDLHLAPRFLVEQGANPDTRNDFGVEPIGCTEKGTEAFNLLHTVMHSPDLTRRDAI